MKNFEIDTNSDSEIVSSENTAVYFEDINLVRHGKEINSLIYVKRISSDDFIYSVDLKIKVLFDSDGDVCYDKVHEYVIQKINNETGEISNQSLFEEEISEILNIAVLETINLSE